jgi:hypothetical protein
LDARFAIPAPRALEHDKSSLLFQLACEHLRDEKIVCELAPTGIVSWECLTMPPGPRRD